MTQDVPPELNTLARRCWLELARGARHADHPWHTPVVATATERGPSARTVVLREADADRRALVLHTDRRSGKADELARDDRLAWVFWDPHKRVQLRCRGAVSRHVGDAVARAAWSQLDRHGRGLYESPLAPGSALGEDPPSREREDGFTHFMVLVCTVEQIDWLALDRDRHRRALIHWRGDDWLAEPIVP